MRLDTIRDAMSVDQHRAATVCEYRTSVFDPVSEYQVMINDEWVATWTTKTEAEAHAKRINEAFEWDRRG